MLEFEYSIPVSTDFTGDIGIGALLLYLLLVIIFLGLIIFEINRKTKGDDR